MQVTQRRAVTALFIVWVVMHMLMQFFGSVYIAEPLARLIMVIIRATFSHESMLQM